MVPPLTRNIFLIYSMNTLKLLSSDLYNSYIFLIPKISFNWASSILETVRSDKF